MDYTHEQRETLESFCQHIDDRMLWQTAEDNDSVQVRLVIDSPTTETAQPRYSLLAKRYTNIGEHALKINIWEQAENSYIGAVGYHKESSAPYCKQVRRDFSEQDMYDILKRAIEINKT